MPVCTLQVDYILPCPIHYPAIYSDITMFSGYSDRYADDDVRATPPADRGRHFAGQTRGQQSTRGATEMERNGSRAATKYL